MDMEDIEKLIESVKKYPCIWDVRLHSYKCNTTKDNAWRQIMREIGTTDCKFFY